MAARLLTRQQGKVFDQMRPFDAQVKADHSPVTVPFQRIS
jgi:hypothetical protein